MAEARIKVGDDISIVVEGVFIAHCITKDGHSLSRVIEFGKPAIWTTRGLIDGAKLYYERRPFKEVDIEEGE